MEDNGKEGKTLMKGLDRSEGDQIEHWGSDTIQGVRVTAGTGIDLG